MTTRNAIRTARDITAECPIGGTCGQVTNGPDILWTYCGYFHAVEHHKQGLKVKCKYKK